ncbi:hypothetical protein GCM10022628_18440 [Anoxybacillus suryakundensis]|uniref:Uncharacterized protein n=1 Tax=Anoxybacillus suryakundensis TaxID=1325335 RepID=A0A0K6GKI0_9BACL|nr:hypothetical protein [Anoxybacillus suryakundensis]CUA79210.1 hypothetical protein Ga0061060_10329 [Anoxybacillus suryakundensis]
MKGFPIRFVLTDEAITPSAGLALIGYLLHQTKSETPPHQDDHSDGDHDGRTTRSPIAAAMDETDAKDTPTECVSKIERGKIANIYSYTHIHHYPLYFFYLFFSLHLHKRGFISFSNMKVLQGIIKKGDLSHFQT